MKKRDKATIYYNIGNLIGFIIIYIFSLYLIFKCFSNVYIRIVLVPIIFIFCGWIEERIMVYIVNPIVWLFLPAEIKKNEIKFFKKDDEIKK